MREFPFLFRLGTDLVRFQAAADQLDAAGYDRRQLRYILLTHAHWDHVSGVPDFPGVPVLVTAVEHRLIDEGGWATAHARSMNAVFQEYAFDGGPYMDFTQSRDLYGDGSIVIVPAPGHTPGSVVVFVTLSGGARYAFVGDLIWQLEGLLEREERPWFEARTLGENPVLLRQSLLRMSAIATRYPQITIVPSHDPRGICVHSGMVTIGTPNSFPIGTEPASASIELAGLRQGQSFVSRLARAQWLVMSKLTWSNPSSRSLTSPSHGEMEVVLSWLASATQPP